MQDSVVFVFLINGSESVEHCLLCKSKPETFEAGSLMKLFTSKFSRNEFSFEEGFRDFTWRINFKQQSQFQTKIFCD